MVIYPIFGRLVAQKASRGLGCGISGISGARLKVQEIPLKALCGLGDGAYAAQPFLRLLDQAFRSLGLSG